MAMAPAAATEPAKRNGCLRRIGTPFLLLLVYGQHLASCSALHEPVVSTTRPQGVSSSSPLFLVCPLAPPQQAAAGASRGLAGRGQLLLPPLTPPSSLLLVPRAAQDASSSTSLKARRRVGRAAGGQSGGAAVAADLVRLRGGGPAVEGGGEEGRSLPSAKELFKEVWSDVLVRGGPGVRSLALTSLALEVLAAAGVIALLWAYFMGGLEWLHPSLKLKQVLLVGMASLHLLVNVIGTFVNAAIITRLAGVDGSVVLPRRWLSLLVFALFNTAYRILVILTNQLLSPVWGLVVLPLVVTRISRFRKHVGLTEQLDAVLPVMLLEDRPFLQAKQRAVLYLTEAWGDVPLPTIRLDKVLTPYLLGGVLGGALPLIVAGKSLQVPGLMAAGFTLVVLLVTALQYTRPLTMSIYALAAYRYSEQGRNDIWKDARVAPSAYQSLAAAKEAKKRSKQQLQEKAGSRSSS